MVEIFELDVDVEGKFGLGWEVELFMKGGARARSMLLWLNDPLFAVL